MFKKMILVIVILYHFTSTAQQYQENEIIEDFNKDGVKDTLHIFRESGTSVSFKQVKLTNGKTNETFKWQQEYPYSCLKHIILLPAALYTVENKPFLEAMKSEILGSNRKDANPSLEWILNGHLNHKNLVDNQYFDLIVNPKTTWRKTDIELSDYYYTEISGDTLSKLYKKSYGVDIPEKLYQKSGFLSYLGLKNFQLRKQDSLMLTKANDQYQTYPLEHGVIVKKDDKYKWLFISDADLTGAPQKLRWKSIGNIELKDKYAIIKQDIPLANASNIYIINIETGVCGRLKYEFSNSNSNKGEIGVFLIENDHLMLSTDYGNELEKISMSDIFKELENQYTDW